VVLSFLDYPIGNLIAFQVGLEQKAKEFVEKGAEIYSKA